MVSIHQQCCSPSLAGVTVYDDGVPRPVSAPGHTGASRLEFLDSATEFYGYNDQHTGFELFTVALDNDGARHTRHVSGLISGFYVDIVGAGGLLYTTAGQVADPYRDELVGRLPVEGAVAVAHEVGRALVRWDGEIRMVDLNTYQLLGQVDVPEVSYENYSGGSIRMVFWGEDGLAFLDGDELIIVRSAAFAR